MFCLFAQLNPGCMILVYYIVGPMIKCFFCYVFTIFQLSPVCNQLNIPLPFLHYWYSKGFQANWAPDSWAPDSWAPDCWAPDSWAMWQCIKSTDICSPNVGSIYPIQIYTLQNVHSLTLRPKGRTENLQLTYIPQMLAAFIQYKYIYYNMYIP